MNLARMFHPLLKTPAKCPSPKAGQNTGMAASGLKIKPPEGEIFLKWNCLILRRFCNNLHRFSVCFPAVAQLRHPSRVYRANRLIIKMSVKYAG